MWLRLGARLARLVWRLTAEASPPEMPGLSPLCQDAGTRDRLYQALRRPAAVAIISVGQHQMLFRHAALPQAQARAGGTAKAAPPDSVLQQIRQLEALLSESRKQRTAAAGATVEAEQDPMLARIERELANVKALDAWL